MQKSTSSLKNVLDQTKFQETIKIPTKSKQNKHDFQGVHFSFSPEIQGDIVIDTGFPKISVSIFFLN